MRKKSQTCSASLCFPNQQDSIRVTLCLFALPNSLWFTGVSLFYHFRFSFLLLFLLEFRFWAPAGQFWALLRPWSPPMVYSVWCDAFLPPWAYNAVAILFYCCIRMRCPKNHERVCVISHVCVSICICTRYKKPCFLLVLTCSRFPSRKNTITSYRETREAKSENQRVRQTQNGQKQKATESIGGTWILGCRWWLVVEYLAVAGGGRGAGGWAFFGGLWYCGEDNLDVLDHVPRSEQAS